MKHLFTCIIFVGLSIPLSAQFVYFTGLASGSSTHQVWRINTATCEVCPVLNYGFNNPLELLILPNGDLLVSTLSDGIFRLDPPNNNPIATIPGIFNGALVHM